MIDLAFISPLWLHLNRHAQTCGDGFFAQLAKQQAKGKIVAAGLGYVGVSWRLSFT